MNISLTIPERLKDLRIERGLDIAEAAKAAGISSSALSNYENNEDKDISHRAIIALAKLYGVSTDYLLGMTEIKNHPNAELHELHLSEKMIQLLKTGKINNRLFCELTEHEDFQRLMIDLEVYVDRIANMRIDDLNAILAAERQAVMSQKSLDGSDLFMRTLELAQIDGDEYFSHVIYEDLCPIIRSIRETHKTDSTTSDSATSPVEEAMQHLKDALNYTGSAEEKQVRVFLSQFGIAYDTLTKDEFITLMGILNKSKYLKGRGSRRGRTHTSHRTKKK